MMNVGTPVPFEMFRRAFEPQVRVRLDWRSLARDGCSVRLTVIDSTAHVAGLFAPWYLTPGGPEVSFRDPGAAPIRLLDIPSVIDRLYEDRAAAIRKLAAELVGYRRPAQFAAVLYSLREAAAIVIDGNHRLAASILAGKPFSVLAFAIDGPVHPSVLPDLQHWPES